MCDSGIGFPLNLGGDLKMKGEEVSRITREFVAEVKQAAPACDWSQIICDECSQAGSKERLYKVILSRKFLQITFPLRFSTCLFFLDNKKKKQVIQKLIFS